MQSNTATYLKSKDHLFSWFENGVKSRNSTCWKLYPNFLHNFASKQPIWINEDENLDIEDSFNLLGEIIEKYGSDQPYTIYLPSSQDRKKGTSNHVKTWYMDKFKTSTNMAGQGYYTKEQLDDKLKIDRLERTVEDLVTIGQSKSTVWETFLNNIVEKIDPNQVVNVLAAFAQPKLNQVQAVNGQIKSDTVEQNESDNSEANIGAYVNAICGHFDTIQEAENFIGKVYQSFASNPEMIKNMFKDG